MKLTASSKDISTALKAVFPALHSRPGLPLLAGVRIEASDGRTALEATDLELSIRRAVADGISVQQPGSAVVPAKALAKAIDSIPNGDVEIEAAQENGRVRLLVNAEKRTVTLDAFPEEDWPSIPDISGMSAVLAADAPILAEAFEVSPLCASKDEMRPTLTGVALFFNERNSVLDVVATDSYRLGAIEVPVRESKMLAEQATLVPARIIRALAKQIKRETGSVRISFEAGNDHGSPVVGFSFGDSIWAVRTLDGEFPAWRQVVPEAEGGLLEFKASEFESAVRGAASVLESKTAPVRLTLDRTCALAVAEPELGTVREELRETSFSPNGVGPVEVMLNAAYLLDGIRFIGGESGRMWVRDGLKPVLFEGRDRRYALMPVRTP